MQISLNKAEYAKSTRPARGVRMKERARQKYMRKVIETASFGKCIVVEYTDSYNIKVQFEDGTIVNTTNSQILQGRIKNPNMPFVSGVGYVGQGIYSHRDNPDCYDYWNNIIERGHCSKYHEKRPTYKDCSVVKEWHNFQNFAKWYYRQIKEENWELDKDLLVKGNRIYGPETCCFVPRALNMLIPHRKQGDNSLPIGVHHNPDKTGYVSTCNDEDGNIVIVGRSKDLDLLAQMYKSFKEGVIKKVAERWKERIDLRLYNSLNAWEI